jgi:hypothetical protein
MKMNTTLKAILTLFIIMIISSCTANRLMTTTSAEITPLSGNPNVTDGSIVYGLPLTVFDIGIEAERTVQKPGPYAAYADDLLGLKDVIKVENEHWTIKGITVKTHEELDPSEFYAIEASSIFQTNVLALKKVGLILELNSSLYDHESNSVGVSSKETSLQRVFDLGSDEYFESRNDTVYKLVNVDTSFIRIPYLVEKKQKLSIDQLAEKAATRLMELRDGKHMILTGESNVFPQNEAAINEINQLEKDHLELFTGKTWKEKRTFTYQVTPGKDMIGKPENVCAFSEKGGPVKSAGKDDILVQVDFIPEHKTKELTFLSGRQKQTNHIYYRVPEVVNARISLGNEVISTSRKLVYQMGDIVQLPANYLIGK